jgi:hypothetical protein
MKPLLPSAATARSGWVGRGLPGRPRPRSADGSFYTASRVVLLLKGAFKSSARWTRAGPAQRAVPHLIQYPVRLAAILLLTLSACRLLAAPARVVINEIHFDPAAKRPLEFIELFNPTAADVNLGNWTLKRFVFSTNTLLPAGGFLVVAQDPAVFKTEFGFQPLGPLPGRLSNGGEKLRLRDAAGRMIDEVNYGAGFPWPTAANGAGSSLERVHPSLPSDDPGSWRSSGFPVVPPASKGVVLIPAEDSQWHWRKGTNEASQPIEAWRQFAFNEDASWSIGRTSIGYEDDDDHTIVPDMRGRYTSLFLRHSFVVGNEPLPPLQLRLRVDDGCVAWINGHEVARLHLGAGPLRFDGIAENHEATDTFEEVRLRSSAGILPGTNLLAIQVFNASKNSSDLTIDAELRTVRGSPQGRQPTPAATNSVFFELPLPSVREVAHYPVEPKSGEPVTVTARVRGLEGQIQSVTLEVQVVEPGVYVRKIDPAYKTNWVSLAMHDDGRDGDTASGDGIFTARVPGSFQGHRRLVRYRVTAVDHHSITVRMPYGDDDCPNFAWFVYDAVPSWTGARRPGHTPRTTFTSDFLATIPIYHLLAREADVSRSQWDAAANRRLFYGTLVYEGRVYDHIQFHNRGTGSAYISGKNKWGIKFNRTHELAARDVHGRPYENRWDSLHLNPGLSTPYGPVHAGIAGLDEALSFRAFQLAGVLSANAHWTHFRIIDSVEESSATNQYAGDLWGLYLAIQDMDGTLLRERGLPDGNIYSIQSGEKHLARGAPLDGSDWNRFIAGIRNDHPAHWWRTNLDLNAYYSFHAISRVIGNVDLRPDGNHGYYRRPDGRWSPFPWDHDMMLVPRIHQPGTIDARRCLDVPSLKIEFQNRAREVLDLFCADASPDGGQVGQLVAELSRVLMPNSFTNDWGELDAAMWDWNPRQNQKGIFYLNPNTGHHSGGSWKRTLVTPDLAGYCRYIVDFCTDSRPSKKYAPNDGDPRGYGFGFLQYEARDGNVPSTPSIRAVPTSGPEHRVYEASPFVSPVTNRFAAVQWRLGEIGRPPQSGAGRQQVFRYEIEPRWQGEESSEAKTTFQIPGGVCEPKHTYRVRARYKDHTDRWSHWSAPVEFVMPSQRDDTH